MVSSHCPNPRKNSEQRRYLLPFEGMSQRKVLVVCFREVQETRAVFLDIYRYRHTAPSGS